MERLKELRVEKGLTQQDLADYLDVSKATYSRYETGVRQPDYTTLLKLSTFFNVSTDYLLGNDHKRNRSTEASFDDQKKMIQEELGDNAVILFKKFKDATPEQLKYIKAILDADDED